MFKAIFKILILFLLVSASVFAGDTGSIIFVVTDSATAEPITDVTIRLIYGGTRCAYTDLNGEAIIRNFESDRYKIIVSKKDYFEKELHNIEVIADSIVTLDINLSKWRSTAEVINVTKIQSVGDNYQFGVIRGIVVAGRTGEPIPGALIQIRSTILGGITNPKGEFLIDSIPPGGYKIITSLQGNHRDIIPNFEILANTAYELKIRLHSYYRYLQKGGFGNLRSKTPRPMLTSSAFGHKGLLPAKYTCDGKNISPPIEVFNLPKQAKSWGIICEKINAIEGNKIHWIIYNIPAEITKLPKNIAKKKNPIIRRRFNKIRLGQWVNDFGEIGYSGPCPELGRKYKYRFNMYAFKDFISIDEDNPDSTMTIKGFFKKIRGLAIGEAKLDTKYWRE